ncbi:cadherin-like domain-containing protein [Vibrio chagasii]|nr:cadherin-like domain-containing protein [Vibrio chagasii]
MRKMNADLHGCESLLEGARDIDGIDLSIVLMCFNIVGAEEVPDNGDGTYSLFGMRTSNGDVNLGFTVLRRYWLRLMPTSM